MHYKNFGYYTYRIDFADGHYYYGRKRIEGDPETDGYYGSPVKHKCHWSTTLFCKTVLFYHYDDEETGEIESLLIGDRWHTDDLCLNATNNKSFTCTGHSSRTRTKMSRSHIGKTLSESTRRRVSESQRQLYATPEGESIKERIAAKRVAKNPLYCLAGPDGRKYQTRNLNKFALEHDLEPSHVYKLKYGKLQSHRGFRLIAVE